MKHITGPITLYINIQRANSRARTVVFANFCDQANRSEHVRVVSTTRMVKNGERVWCWVALSLSDASVKYTYLVGNIYVEYGGHQ